MTWFTKTLKKFFELDRFDFNNITLSKNVVDTMIEFARTAYPNEFIAFLQGKIENKTLKINSLMYQHFQSSHTSAALKAILQPLTNAVGSVHSHPSYSNNPSQEDLRFFNKNPGIHLIICQPFNIENIAAYDYQGKKLNFKII
ncbi:MAG: Mov34/MPN/PAD-1 family protein [Candidatus Woesearchaeota archaeon]|nr:Mov34/MPN/PAD-1 family protein [Candidatus Woesearchaeota archaeon]